MPNLVEQRITDDEIYLLASNGKEVRVKRAEIDAALKVQVGDDKTKAAVVAELFCQSIADALGSLGKKGRVVHDMISPAEIGLIIDPVKACATVIVAGKDAKVTAASAATATKMG